MPARWARADTDYVPFFYCTKCGTRCHKGELCPNGCDIRDTVK